MPNVSEQFVKHAVALAKNAQKPHAKEASEQLKVEQGHIELVADTLIEQGLVPANQKQAAVQQLSDPALALQTLNKVAQMVRADTIGEPVGATTGQEKVAHDADGEPLRESDQALYRALGLM